MEPNPERTRAVSAARANLDRGFRFEQSGSLDRALESYRDALAGADGGEQVEARLRIARVLRSVSELDGAVTEAREAIRLATALGSEDLAAEAMNVEVGVLQMRGQFEDAH